jgi:hypothetical protein
MAFENQAKLYCSQIAQIIIGLILDNFGIVGFLFFSPIPVDSSHVSLHFDNILSPKSPKYFILNVLKRSLIPSVRTNWRAVLSLSRLYSTFPLSSGTTLNLN